MSNNLNIYKIIGSGAFGIVIYPAISFNKNITKKLVSKISEEDDNEYKLLNAIKCIDKDGLFHFKSIENFEVNIDLMALIEGGRQKQFEKKINIVLEKSLLSFDKFKTKDINIFLKAVTSLFAGCYIMSSNHFYHLDIKADNILVDRSNELNPTNSDYSLKYIDFNFSCYYFQNKLKYTKKFSKSIDKDYPVWPVEVIYLSRSMRYLLNNQLYPLFEVDESNIDDEKFNKYFDMLKPVIEGHITYIQNCYGRSINIGSKINIIKIIKLYYDRVYSKLHNKFVNMASNFNEENKILKYNLPESSSRIIGDKYDTKLLDDFNMWILKRIDIYSLCSVLIKYIEENNSLISKKFKEFINTISGNSLVDQMTPKKSFIIYLKFLVDNEIIDESDMNKITDKVDKLIYDFI